MRPPINVRPQDLGLKAPYTASEFESKFSEFLDGLLKQLDNGATDTVEYIFAGPTVELFKVTLTCDEDLLVEWEQDSGWVDEYDPEPNQVLEGVLSEYQFDGVLQVAMNWVELHTTHTNCNIHDDDDSVLIIGYDLGLKFEPAH